MPSHLTNAMADPAVSGAQPRYATVAFNLPVDREFSYHVPPELTIELGSRVIAPFGRRSLAGLVTAVDSTRPKGSFEIKSISRVTNAEPLFDERLLELARWVKRMYFCSLGEALSAMVPGGRREMALPSFLEEVSAASSELSLSEEQARALETILTGEERLYYLYGITGSGKTEVFLQAAERTISSGRGVIYLVPEISLTHQLLDSVRSRFEGKVAVLHSRLTGSQRLTEWQRIRNGEAMLVIGARSAVFAPFEKLGLVVIDEEHDGSYKSGAAPRYHARQVAMKRVADHDARVVMGSATPSVEAWHLMHAGRIRRLTLSKRLSGGDIPTLRSVDLNRDPGPLSRELIDALKKTHDAGRQSILFLNRRGFAHFFHCRSCGHTMQCKNCSVGMTYHKAKNLLTCHYCGYKTRPVTQCPECRSFDVGYSGFGTERIAEELDRLFPQWSIERLDTDSVKKKGTLEQTIRAFREGSIDVLLGTQMVAKGLNFPGVKFVGIVLADTGLHMPDFRAAERTFGLIVQVAGRAGRYHPDGEVLVQSYAPGNIAISRALELDIESFYREELAAREQLGFPPFARLIRFVVRGRQADAVGQAVGRLAELLTQRTPSAAEILGPAECPLGVIAGNHRHQVIVRTSRFGETHQEVEAALQSFAPPAGLYLEVDVDPVALL